MNKPFIVKLGNAWDAGNGQVMVYAREQVVNAIKSAFGRIEEKSMLMRLIMSLISVMVFLKIFHVLL